MRSDINKAGKRLPMVRAGIVLLVACALIGMHVVAISVAATLEPRPGVASLGEPSIASSDIRGTQDVTSYVFLPVVSNPATVDLSITGLEATQSVQTMSNSVPMVAGRATVLRVYTRASGSQPVGNIRVSVAGTRGGSPLPGSPVVTPLGTVPISPSRGTYASTFNVSLPSSWTSGLVALTATVDAGNALAETNEENNTAIVALTFNSVPALSIKIVPVNYTHTPNGQFYPAPTVDTVSGWIMRSYPVSAVNVSWHAPVDFSGDLKANLGNWSSLLDEVSNLRDSESVPAGQVYYGLVPIDNGSSNWLGSGGVVGLGWIGYRAALGLDLTGGGWGADQTGQTAAHEIGHNLGRYHAPCGNPASPDPSYPYAGASIGEYGLDILKGRVWSPVAPDNAKDLMSYCHPQWLSDYTYTGLYNDQRARGLMTTQAAEDTWLIRADWQAGKPVLKPVYALHAAPTEPAESSEYAIELLDEAGQVVASHPVEVFQAQEPGIAAQAVSARVPRPGQRVARVRLVRAGQPMAERALASAAAAMEAPTIERNAGAITLRWGVVDVPALVRYTVDDGGSWTTFGMDVMGGQWTLARDVLPSGPGRFEVTLADGMASASVAFVP